MSTEKDNSATIGSRIRLIRELLSLSQSQLAEKIGFSGPTVVSKYELNQREIDLISIHKLANLGNISVDWLISGKGWAFIPFLQIDAYKFVDQILSNPIVKCVYLIIYSGDYEDDMETRKDILYGFLFHTEFGWIGIAGTATRINMASGRTTAKQILKLIGAKKLPLYKYRIENEFDKLDINSTEVQVYILPVLLDREKYEVTVLDELRTLDRFPLSHAILDSDLLKDVIEVVETTFAELKLKLPPQKKAEFISLLFEQMYRDITARQFEKSNQKRFIRDNVLKLAKIAG